MPGHGFIIGIDAMLKTTGHGPSVSNDTMSKASGHVLYRYDHVMGHSKILRQSKFSVTWKEICEWGGNLPSYWINIRYNAMGGELYISVE